MLIAFFVILIFLSACDRQPTSAEPTKSQDSSNTRTEQLWIIESIVRDIADMAVFASNRKDAPLPQDALKIEPLPSKAHGYHYNISVRLPGASKPTQLPLEISGPIWDPSAYQPLSRVLFEQLNLKGMPDSTAIKGNPIHALISPLAQTIQQENERVSSFLTEHPLSPEAHEQAALIVGVLGVRENSGVLWDARGMNNRATAHLAFARAIRGDQPMSDSGEVAELLIGLEADLKKDCEQRIGKLKEHAQAKPELSPWVIAAQLRNRRDWRVLEKPTEASLLERIEYFRAKCESVSPEAASQELLKKTPENISDWSCIILQFNFSVGAGHVFTGAGLKNEFQEISQVFPATRTKQLAADALAETLNKTPSPAVRRDASGNVTITPIDEGMWALFFQRHLCHIVSETDCFLRDKWGVPEQAAKFEDTIGKLFSKLTFAPIMHVMWNNSRNADRARTEQAVALVKQHPEWIPSASWRKIPRTAAAKVPAMSAWFSPGLPAGTAYCYYDRVEYIPSVKHIPAEELRKLYEIAPWQYGIAFNYMKSLYGEKPTLEQFRSVMGPFLEFQVGAMGWYAFYAKDDQKEYVAIHRRISKLDPNDYLTLSDYYKEHKMDAEAAEALQAALDNDADPVRVANASGFLVNYYFDHDQKDRALTVAKFADEVYSFRGLAAMAELQERMGNPEEAESYFEKIKERYDNAGPLLAFYQRQTDINPNSPYEAKLKSSLGSTFPDGIKSVTLADFVEPPKNGVIIGGQSDFLLKCGMKKGSIIVALDGKRTQDYPQYTFFRELTKSSHMEFIVFQNGKYQPIIAEVPERIFGVQFSSWVKGSH